MDKPSANIKTRINAHRPLMDTVNFGKETRFAFQSRTEIVISFVLSCGRTNVILISADEIEIKIPGNAA